ncbi:hypothetical protein EV426DRAFT_389403 [Tirmania nivea]|nr:hypothetical protein EV426DRAFT_389403 [Tirmania nivea]
MCSTDSFLALLAVLFPPLAVWVKRGICSADSLINFALCCLGYLPGLLHAWYIIAKYPEESCYYPIESESSYPPAPHVYYFGPQGGPPPDTCPGPQAHSPAPPPRPNPGYGVFQQQYPQSPSPHPPAMYTNYQQQTPGDGLAGPSNGQGGLPSYAEVVRGDFKVQTQD